MKLQWYWPDLQIIGLTGKFSIVWVDWVAEAHTTPVAVIRDVQIGWSILRVSFESSEELKDAEVFMQNMLEVALIKLNDLKEKNDKTASV